jgi:AraC family transcriptional regulator
MTHIRRTLLDSLGIGVVDFRCRAHVEPLGPEERNPAHSIVFVRRGVFRRTRGRESLVADPNHVLFFNAGEAYRYAHPLPGGDECTILEIDGARALELVQHHAPRDAERPESPFRHGCGLAAPSLARRHYELLALLREGAPQLAIEDAAAELADASVAAVHHLRAADPPREARSAAARRRRRDLVEAVKVVLNERLESLPGLGALASSLDCSPFHLSRTFHRVAGSSLRAYVGRLRARRAAERLADGTRDLTGLALELGYADHSHLTNAFRKEWGLPPSRFRERHRRDDPDKIFQAASRSRA